MLSEHPLLIPLERFRGQSGFFKPMKVVRTYKGLPVPKKAKRYISTESRRSVYSLSSEHFTIIALFWFKTIYGFSYCHHILYGPGVWIGHTLLPVCRKPSLYCGDTLHEMEMIYGHFFAMYMWTIKILIFYEHH